MHAAPIPGSGEDDEEGEDRLVNPSDTQISSEGNELLENEGDTEMDTAICAIGVR